MPLVCTIELSKVDGITITVDNADGKILQTIVMNGTSIVTTVKGNEKTSKITQLQDQVKIEVKDFIIEAETITCTSTGATAHKSEDTLSIESTKDMTVTSSAKLTATATADAKLTSSAKVDIEATADATFKGLNMTVEGTTATKLKGAQVEVAGTGKVDMKGPMIKVAADAKLDLEGAMLTLKGQMETFQGSMVKIG